MNKIFVTIYIPLIEEKFEMFIPIDKEVIEIINLILKGVNSLVDIDYVLAEETNLYDKTTGKKYLGDKKIYETDIKNGCELIIV